MHFIIGILILTIIIIITIITITVINPFIYCVEGN